VNAIDSDPLRHDWHIGAMAAIRRYRRRTRAETCQAASRKNDTAEAMQVLLIGVQQREHPSPPHCCGGDLDDETPAEQSLLPRPGIRQIRRTLMLLFCGRWICRHRVRRRLLLPRRRARPA
jgi:hypothetical protein